ncbi:HAD family phosphatase [Streptomyces sp. NPDC051162]|uniref:HAD family hydrolase n=1 Tax=Streptomyces sp. NPDC051162 TaxID=3154747 RepID=UPI0034298755
MPPPAPHPLTTEIEAVVFDCDGLLVDTESCWTRAEAAVFEEHGHAFGLEQKKLLIGRTPTDLGFILADRFGRPGQEKALTATLLDRVRQELEEGVALLPGALELVRTCAERVPVAVASNSPRPLLEIALNSTGLADLLPVSLAVEDVPNPKPAPDLYLAACAVLGAKPARSVAFEDSRTGVAAARAAGLRLVVVPSLPDAEPRADTGDDWLLESLAEPALHQWADALTVSPGSTALRG